MAWPGGKEIDYKAEFGVENKEALLAKLAKVSELETSNTTLKTTVETQAGEVNTVKETLRLLEEKVNNNTTQNQNNNNNNNNNNQEVEIPSVTDDENAAFATRMAPLWQRTLETNAKFNKMEAVNKLKANDPYFPKLEKEFNDLVKTMPLQQLGHERGGELIENAYHVVRSRHMDQILQDTKAGKGDFFIESAGNSSNGGTGRQDNKTDPNTLTPDEEIIVARMGISKESYLKTKNAGVNTSGALRYA